MYLLLFLTLLLVILVLIWYIPLVMWLLSNGKFFNNYVEWFTDEVNKLIDKFRINIWRLLKRVR